MCISDHQGLNFTDCCVIGFTLVVCTGVVTLGLCYHIVRRERLWHEVILMRTSPSNENCRWHD